MNKNRVNMTICLLMFMFSFLMLKANIQVCLTDVHSLNSNGKQVSVIMSGHNNIHSDIIQLPLH